MIIFGIFSYRAQFSTACGDLVEDALWDQSLISDSIPKPDSEHHDHMGILG